MKHDVMKQWSFVLVLAILVSVLLTPRQASAETLTLTIVHTNDIYNVEYDVKEDRGGFARLASVVAQERASSKHVLFTHAGDTFSPSLLSGFDQGAHIVALTNLLQPDVFVPGNHEFDFGEDVFRQHVAAANFPIYAANLRDAQNKKLEGIDDARIHHFGPLKVGIVGLAADNSPVLSSPGSLKFNDAKSVGVATAEVLRDNGADIVIAVTHSPRPQDQELFQTRAFDLILSGDDHDTMLFYDGKTAMIESGEEANVVIVIDLLVEIDEERGRVSWHPQFRFVDTADVTPDPEVLKAVETYTAQLSKELDIEIGTTSTPLDSRRQSVRGTETAIGNLFADAIRIASDADTAIMNGGGIRGNKEYPAGTILTRRDILSELPFGNRLVKLEVTGATLRQALENAYSQVEKGAGRYAQLSGVSVTLDLDQEPRVKNVMINGTPLNDTKVYTLATNNYIAGGGDGYTILKEAKVLIGALDGKLLANEVIDYILESGTIAPKIEGRIQD